MKSISREPLVQRALLVALVVSLVVPLALPRTARADDDGSAPVNGAGVARLSLVEGHVGIGHGDANTTVGAVINAPLLAGDYVTTGAQSRAEIQFDGIDVIRLGENVQLRVSHVDDDGRQIQLAAGTIDVRLLRGNDGENAIDTPSISVLPRTTGTYRVTVDDDGTTFVTVRSGQADIDTPQGAQPLGPGTTMVAQGTAANPHLSNRDEIANDGFDAFNADRDNQELAALAQSPSADVGIDGGDLGNYGNWTDDGSYGQVWMPNGVAAGWAPYRDGSWAWEGAYGWTWIGAEPWGWAPYHYGRWYFSTSYRRWAWCPPARGYGRPAWSPALVGFVGLSIGAVNVGVGFGHIGWVPLAPHEAFHPWWGPHATTITNNVTYENTYDVTHVYRNAQYSGMSSVSVENFRAGHFAGTSAVSPDQLALARPVPMRGALPVTPAGSNLRYSSEAPGNAREVPPSFGRQQPSVDRATMPSYARSNASGYDRGQSSYSRPSYAAPSYTRQSYNAAPSYNRPSYTEPLYNRPSYNTAPSYYRPSYSAPSYNRQSYSQPGYAQQYRQPSYARSAPAPARAAAPASGRGGRDR